MLLSNLVTHAFSGYVCVRVWMCAGTCMCKCVYVYVCVRERDVYIAIKLGDNRIFRVSHTATHCNTLQHTATHCNTLQHTVTH